MVILNQIVALVRMKEFVLCIFIHSTILLINFLRRKGVVHKLIPGLEKHRNAELAERKEKRKKQHGSEKENEKDNKEEKERSNNAECKFVLVYFSRTYI